MTAAIVPSSLEDNHEDTKLKERADRTLPRAFAPSWFSIVEALARCQIRRKPQIHATIDIEVASRPFRMPFGSPEMIEIYCDESQDDHTYTLAGWLASPTGWNHFRAAWRAMLKEFPVEYFHASELARREVKTNGRYKGWSRDEEVRFFTRAVDVICDERHGCGWTHEQELPRRLGCGGPSFVLREAHARADRVRFANDEEDGFEPLQAADLLAYEWRHRISDCLTQPDKPMRTSYRRIREARSRDTALHHYNAAAVDRILAEAKSGNTHFVAAMLACPSTEE